VIDLRACDPSHARTDSLTEGALIGPYRIERLIGTGGMAEVYLAVQTSPVQRRVALKLVKQGMDSRAIVSRFRKEQSTLARLSHPNISTLFDAGVAADGRPYLIMEYLDGASLTEHCRQHQCSLVERLDLFQQACEAVAFAHRNLIIHRDLKPSNILVVTDGANWRPKLLDFGIARMVEPDRDVVATLTRPEFQVMTPEYASPEQVRGEPLDTRTDVYSLGVILYELLTDQRPYEVASMRYRDYVRVICEDTLPAPSARVELAQQALGSPPATARRLRGDLDTIALHALHKDPERRYSSVEQLVEDIGRHRRGEPISARPESWWYLTRKFMIRRRMPLASAAVVLASLVLSLIVTISLYQRAEADRVESERQLRAMLLADGARRLGMLAPGSAEAALDAAQRAAVIAPGPDTRQLAISALSRPSLRETKRWTAPSDTRGSHVKWAPDGSRIAVITKDWHLVVCGDDAGEELWRRPVPEYAAAPVFSCDGRFVVATGERPSPRQRVVRESSTGEAIARLSDLGTLSWNNLRFDPRAPQKLWMCLTDGRLVRRDIVSGHNDVVIQLESGPAGVAIHPRAPLALVWFRSGGWEVWDFDSGTRVGGDPASEPLLTATWGQNSTSSFFAVAGANIMKYSVTGDIRSMFGAHQARALEVHPSQPWLLSYAWDGTSRIWDVLEEREIFRITGAARDFAPAGDAIGSSLRQNGKTETIRYALHESPVLRRFSAAGEGGTAVAFLGSRFLASGHLDGVQIWDLTDGRPIGNADIGWVRWLHWNKREQRLLALGRRGAFALRPGDDGWRTISIEQMAEDDYEHGSPLQDGRGYLVLSDSNLLQAVDPQFERRSQLTTLVDATHLAVSPSGDLAAVGSSRRSEIWIHALDGSGSTRVLDLAPRLGADLSFGTSDDRLLVATDGFILEVDPFTMEILRSTSLDNPRAATISPTLSPNGRVLVAGGGGGVELRHAETLKHLATLPIPFGSHAHESAVFSPDGRFLASAMGARRDIAVWDLEALDRILTECGMPILNDDEHAVTERGVGPSVRSEASGARPPGGQ